MTLTAVVEKTSSERTGYDDGNLRTTSRLAAAGLGSDLASSTTAGAGHPRRDC